MDTNGDNVYLVEVTASDGERTSNQLITITIADQNDPPTPVTLSANTVLENQAVGTVVAILGSSDEDGDSLEFSLGSSAHANLFEIVGNELRTKSVFDYENSNHRLMQVSILVRDGRPSGSTVRTYTIDTLNIDEPPQNVRLSNSNVLENEPTGSLVGYVLAEDPENAGSITYTLVGGLAHNSNFSISGNQLLTTTVFDAEASTNYTIRIRATDVAGGHRESDFLISIAGVNEFAPLFVSPSIRFIAENTNSVSIAATYADRPASPLTYSVVGGADQTKFNISNAGILSFITTPNFEMPGDADADNSYLVQVRVRRYEMSTIQSLLIRSPSPLANAASKFRCKFLTITCQNFLSLLR